MPSKEQVPAKSKATKQRPHQPHTADPGTLDPQRHPATIIKQAGPAARSLDPGDTSSLQSTVGNRAVLQLLRVREQDQAIRRKAGSLSSQKLSPLVRGAGSFPSPVVQLKRFKLNQLALKKDAPSDRQEYSSSKQYEQGGYNFVKMDADSPILMSKQGGHPQISEGAESVYYAGEIHFDEDGKLRGWTNQSGHYLPDATYAYQAGLPLEKFTDYEFWLEEGRFKHEDSFMGLEPSEPTFIKGPGSGTPLL